jgi:hypothetical protein
MIGRLEITARGPSRREARLDEFVYRGPGSGDACFALANGDRWVIRSTARAAPGGLEREVRQWLVLGDSLRPLDRTVFTCDPAHFVEKVRQRTENGPNLHPRPIALPATWSTGTVVEPMGPGAGRVALVYVGPAHLRLGGTQLVHDALLIEATVGGVRRWQWLAKDVGEVAPAEAPFERWLVGWTSPEHTLFQAVPRFSAYPPLPAIGSTAETQDVFG